MIELIEMVEKQNTLITMNYVLNFVFWNILLQTLNGKFWFDNQ